MAFALAIILILLSSSSASLQISKSASGCFESIVSFGDSLADTGNLIRLRPADKPPRSANRPFGRNFFHHPTGRFSDGRLAIDFIAQSLGLPLVPPYIGGEAADRSFSKGVNFAVAGATALDYEFYEKKGIPNMHTNVSLGIQLDWFKQFLATIPDSRKFLQRSLVLMGEIGGNDYNHALEYRNISSEVIKSFVPLVVDYIGFAIEEVIKVGGERVLVPGNLPIGCNPVYLTQFYRKGDYEPETGCLKSLNELSRYHNEQLNKELNRLQLVYPHVTIIYADYYNAAIRFFVSPHQFGFSSGEILTACCGAGGPYNVNETALCGIKPATCCEDPSLFVSWDGIHFTEAAYRFIAQPLLHQITSLCPLGTQTL